MKNNVKASPQGKFWRVAEHRLHILPCVRLDRCVICPAVVKNAMELGKSVHFIFLRAATSSHRDFAFSEKSLS